MIPSGPAVQRTIQVERGADQRQVRERLREVARRLARGPDLLGVQADVVRVCQHLLEHRACASLPARVKASTNQKEHRLNVPSGSVNPSAPSSVS